MTAINCPIRLGQVGVRTDADLQLIVDNVNADEAMFVGLVHDVGKLYILSRVGNHPELFRNPSSVAEFAAESKEEIDNLMSALRG